MIDESHYLKNKDTQRYKMLSPIMKSARHLLLLSGTPALARPVELYPQVSGSLPAPRSESASDVTRQPSCSVDSKLSPDAGPCLAAVRCPCWPRRCSARIKTSPSATATLAR